MRLFDIIRIGIERCDLPVLFLPNIMQVVEGICMLEKWCDIDGYDGKYQVSNSGKVRSFVNNKWGTTKTPHLLKEQLTGTGYPMVFLRDSDGKQHVVMVHRLVAKSFIPNPDGKPEVNHINGDKLDYSISNLEWVTGSENQKHAHRFLKRKPVGKSVKCVETGTIYKSIADAHRKTGVCRMTIGKAARRAIYNNGRTRHLTAGGYHWELVNKP